MDKRQMRVIIAKKRIMNILDKHRVSSTRHLQMKISEAGPSHLRVEPAILHAALKQMKSSGHAIVLTEDPIELIGPNNSKPGDKGKLQKFLRLLKMYTKYTSGEKNHTCGLHFEKLIYNTVVDDYKDTYHILGNGPIDDGTRLSKVADSEIIYFNGNESYKKSGLDLFLIHKKTAIPIGIEAKNMREWIYPASYEVWRMIAKGCTLNCLPVLIARKISYITIAGLFARVGIIGFQSHNQYFSPRVKADSKYKFNEIIHKDGLGFHDIIITNENPEKFAELFGKILPNNLETYFQKFLQNKSLLQKYAIDLGMANKELPQKKRFSLYHEFRSELEYEDPEFPEFKFKNSDEVDEIGENLK